MTINIQKISDREVQVNQKQVIKDMNENWVCKARLERKEIRAFQRYINIIEKLLPGSDIKVKSN